jgi:phosphate/sulfate permease
MKSFEEEQLREEYTKKEKTGVDEAIKLDKKAKLPATIFTFSFGIVGALILGVGMCLAMKVIGDASTVAVVMGIIIGVVGIAIVAVNYPLYKKILKSRKEKYSAAILVALNQNSEKK